MSTGFEKTILFAAIEDYVGLWELLWEFADQPEITEEEMRPAIADLTQRGLIKLYFCREPYGELSAVEFEGYEKVLANLYCWVVPGVNQTGIRASATKQGEAYYRSLLE